MDKNKSQEILDMVERMQKKRDTEPLTPCWPRYGFGIVIQVHPQDEGEIRAHVYDLNYRELAEILNTEEVPTNPDDILVYKGHLSRDDKLKIIKWANHTDDEIGFKNWYRIENGWECSHDR